MTVQQKCLEALQLAGKFNIRLSNDEKAAHAKQVRARLNEAKALIK